MMIDYVTFGIGRKTMIMSRWRNGPGVGGEDTGTTGIGKFLCTGHSRLSAARENSSSNVKPKLLQRRQMSSISTSAG